MRYAISQLPTGFEDRAPAADEDGSGTTSVRFGNVLFHMTEGSSSTKGLGAGRGAGAQFRTLDHETPRGRLHLVVQKGRLFQQEHPEVPVLLDKGRYLVVDLDPKKAKKWDCGDRPCYSIRPLPREGVAFDLRAPRASRAASIPWVQALVDRLDRASYKADLKQLIDAKTRFSTSPEYAAVAKSARAQLKAMGYEARLQTITVNGAASSNVIADKAGKGPAPRKVVVVGAHLDSINIAGGPSAPAPGADDDGSGSAGVQAIARVLKDHPAVHDIRLILFGGEEEGLFGSRQYVASLPVAQRKRIHSVVHMDMIATMNVAAPSVLLEGDQSSRAVIDGLADAAATYSHLQVQTSLHPFNSDHVSFLDAGIPAVLTIEGTDDANHHIHSAGDTLDHISFDLALDILRMNLAFVATNLGKVT
jgi:Peptidase family M28